MNRQRLLERDLTLRQSATAGFAVSSAVAAYH